jgi:hypothetical protein
MRTRLRDQATLPGFIKNLKNTVLAVKYMARQDINGFYHTQGIRIGNYFQMAEQAMVNNYMNQPAPYTPLNLQAMWLQFLREYTNSVIEKLESYLQLWSGQLVVWLPENGQQPTVLQQKVMAIRQEIATLTAGTLFNNPF